MQESRQNERKGSTLLIGKMHLPLKYVPSWEFDCAMVPPISRRHVTFGLGVPVAAHRNVTLLPSCTSMSVLVESSRISGGTETMTTLQR
ncbi:hypothetical protein K0M31_007313 [Melipona bicolor]|uniref:Uncharacterized protein n=1 Tax=Melipona bicolor TaxID=60889 RepID=A0AA40GBF4_9HYME|nr:hypothetical protein K0M31_007313 [Melipona bicolor]